MRTVHLCFRAVLFILFASTLQAQQGVIISRQSIPEEPGAILHVQSTSQGVLIPRTTVDSIAFPVNGLLIFDTTDNDFKYFRDTAWVTLVESSSFFLSYADHDGDTFGDPLSALYAPFTPPGYFTGVDCNDSNPAIFPGQTELCDGVDNDCDPVTTDGSDEPTVGQPCDGADTDLCIEGIYQCVNGVLGCSDVTGDTPEVCDGVDNDCDGQTDENCPLVDIDFAILQFPPSVFMMQGVTPSIYGQVYSQGVTDNPGQGPGITSQVGYGAENTDPSLGSWTWVNATYSSDVGNNDEYVGILNVAVTGFYDYAYRFSGDYGLTWTYADLNGSGDGYQIANAGEMEVVDDLCNGVDDDGDNLVDESCPELGQSCDGDDSDLCAGGTIVCLPDGDCGCDDDAASIPEVCNGVDDDCDGLVDEDCSSVDIDFAILQFPASIFMLPGTTNYIYGRVYAEGVTEGAGQGAGILAEVGYGLDGSNPASGGWTWVAASFNMDQMNQDEYKGMLSVTSPGFYDYAYRFSGNYGFSWTYADLNGSTDGYQIANAGDMEVTDDPCNGIDDDGDNLVDESCPELGQPCDGDDADLCAGGTIVCLPDGDCECDDDANSILEVCNGIDDDCDGMVDEGCPPVTIDWGNLQFPPTINMSPGNTPLIYGQVYAQGVTDMAGQGPGILAQVGYGADGSDPSAGGWTWVSATYNTDSGNNDEYQGTLTVTLPGSYDYAYRYSGDGGVTWLYCDLGAGSADGYAPADAGQLTVN